MTNFDTSYVAQVIVNAYEDGTDKYSALAEVVCAIADELGHYMFLPGNDCRIIDASSVYKIANVLENLK
jgi:hypothetical protein